MISPKQADVSLLLEVFRDGLLLGMISKQEVVAWADDIINKDDDCDYLFIDISLSSDVNSLLTVINEYVIDTDNPICTRVLWGCIYRRMLADNDIEKVEEIAAMVASLQNWDNSLEAFESDKIYLFEDYEYCYMPDTTQLQVELINFLSIYEPFTLGNYAQWNEINNEILEVIKIEEAEEEKINAPIRQNLERQQKKARVINNLKISLLLIFLFALLIGTLSILPHALAFIYLVYIACRLLIKWWGKK